MDFEAFDYRSIYIIAILLFIIFYYKYRINHLSTKCADLDALCSKQSNELALIKLKTQRLSDEYDQRLVSEKHLTSEALTTINELNQKVSRTIIEKESCEKELISQLTDLQRERDQALQRAASAESAAGGLQKTIDQLKEQLSAKEAECATAQNDRERFRQNSIQAREKCEKKEQEIKRLNRQLDADARAYKGKISNLEERLRKATKQLEEKDKELISARLSELLNLEKLNQQLSDEFEAKFKSLQSERDDYRAKYSEAQNKRNWLNAVNQRLQSRLDYLLNFSSPAEEFYRLGTAYELQIGREYEKKKYTVLYSGIVLEKEDNGIDLILISSRDVLLVQCKNFSDNTPIEAHHIKSFVNAIRPFSSKHGISVRPVLVCPHNNISSTTQAEIEKHNIECWQIIFDQTYLDDIYRQVDSIRQEQFPLFKDECGRDILSQTLSELLKK